MYRLLILVHRYLGIVFGLIVALWCLSGFVMMYVQYPDLSDQEYLSGLRPLETSDCCVANQEVLEQLADIDELSIEMLAGQPAMRVRYGRDISLLVNLRTGWWFSTIDQESAMLQADAFLAASGIDGETSFVARRMRDQWTVAGYFNAYRPLFHFAGDDDAETHVYVSGVNGQVIQTTTSTERFWNWFGAVTHWIYPTVIRQNTPLWTQVVIWLTIPSLFLIVVGIYLGIKQYGAQSDGSRSPYKGLNLWHHYSGLIFALVTVTWLFSGLLSMNPWGAFEGDSGSAERSRLQNSTVSVAQLNNIVTMLGDSELPSATVQIRSVPVDGTLALVATDSSGRGTRLDATTLRPDPLAENAWERVVEMINPDTPVLQAGMIDSADRYYFSHHEEVSFPVYRIEFDDDERTRYYLDPTTAELLQKVDSNRRWNRWLFEGLHRGDFTAWMRQRPIWDLILLPLMIGVTIGAITGVWMAYRRLRQ
jgi:uncharacterized iron-regulated membrane protein